MTSAPDFLATSAVSSIEPSFTTSISGTWFLIAGMREVRATAQLYAGIIASVFMGMIIDDISKSVNGNIGCRRSGAPCSRQKLWRQVTTPDAFS